MINYSKTAADPKQTFAAWPQTTDSRKSIAMKITVETLVRSDVDSVWSAWNSPDDIKRWNAASVDWHTTASTVDLREGGSFSSRMEAKDGSAGFDFSGNYSKVVPNELIEYSLEDGRAVSVEFLPGKNSVRIKEIFDADAEFSQEHQ